MPSSRPSIAACLVLQGGTPPALQEDLRSLVGLADEVVVYDTADHLAPGTPAFEATLHPAVVAVSGFWAEDRERAREAALAHVRSEWVLCLLAGERVRAAPEQLRELLAAAGDAPAMSVCVDDVLRGTHRAVRLLHRTGAAAAPPAPPAQVPEVPGAVLTVHQPATTCATSAVPLPRQRGASASATATSGTVPAP